MIRVKITKKLLNGKKLTVSESVISNGHWAIRRHRVENEKSFTPAVVRKTGIGEVLTDEAIFKTVPWLNGVKPYSTVEYRWDRKMLTNYNGDLAVFECGKKSVLFKRVYVEGLQIAALCATSDKADKPFVTPDGEIVLMPCARTP